MSSDGKWCKGKEALITHPPQGTTTKEMISIALAAAMLNVHPASQDPRLDWWREARFGMFIHFGLYSIPAGKWNGQDGYGEWIRDSAKIPVHEYEKFQGQFNPSKFNADEWARMAKDAGMKYVVITTKHHDGFNLFDSKYTDWSVKNTPFHRDIMKELSTAVRGQGLQMGWYHSIMDWHHPDYLPRRGWEVGQRPNGSADFKKFVQYLHNDVKQLLTDYGPIGVMWFDGEWENTWTRPEGKALYDLCRQLQPNVIVNDRVGPGSNGGDAEMNIGDYGTPEQYIPATGIPGKDWETCMTMNDHWGYNAADKEWKSSKQLIRNLIETCSKGGNYLLNIGPEADGTFPPEAVERLHDIGEWMHRNGEAIYGTSASLIDELKWGRTTTKRNGENTTIYLHVFEWPKDGKLVVPGVGNEPLGAGIIGARGMQYAHRVGPDIVVDVPEYAPDLTATVVALELKGAPVIYRVPVITADSEILVDSTTVKLSASAASLSVHYTLDGSEPTVTSPLASGAVTITETSTLKAATFDGDKRVSAIAEKAFTKVEPWHDLVVMRAVPGIRRQTFHGSWDVLPDFDKLNADEDNPVQALDVPMLHDKPEENVGRRYQGFISVPENGVYNFALTSDDGSRLWIDGKLVVDADGLHGTTTFNGAAPLAKGYHGITVGWFNKTGDAYLGLKWAKAGQALKPLGSFVH